MSIHNYSTHDEGLQYSIVFIRLVLTVVSSYLSIYWTLIDCLVLHVLPRLPRHVVLHKLVFIGENPP